MVKSLLITSLGMCKFVMLHENHPITQAIKQFHLLDPAHIDRFLTEVRKLQNDQILSLDLKDEILIYTAMDITCKAYMTDLGDRMESINREQNRSGSASFSEIRSTVLTGCKFVMDGMKETLGSYPEFDDRIDILDNYIIIS